MKLAIRCAFPVLLLAASLGTSAQPASGDYPNRPLTLVVPYSPGGGADVIARAVAKTIGESLKQPIVIDNKPGGSGQIAAAFVAKAAPDGYTLLLNADNIYSINPALKGKPAQEVLARLAPVANFVGAPVVVAVSADSVTHASSLAELIAYAKKSGVPLSYASPGIGTPHQLIAESIGQAAGIALTHVPYKGTANALTDLIGGQVDVLFGMPSSVTPMVTAGKVKVLAVTSFEPFPLLPGTPTVAQTYGKVGMSTVDMGLAVPTGTPPAIVRKLHDEVQKALVDRDVQNVVQQNGMVALPGTTEDYRKRMQVARVERERMIIDAGVKPE